jgi:hypothetical protein
MKEVKLRIVNVKIKCHKNFKVKMSQFLSGDTTHFLFQFPL